MKKNSMFTSALAVLFVLQSNIAGQTELEDSITLRAKNPGTATLTNNQVQQMLRKADFEGHGFQKEELHILLSAGKFPANPSAYMTNIFYYKKADCSQAKQVLMEAEKILPGTMKPSGSSRDKVVREMKVFLGGNPMATCKAGVEIHVEPKPRQISKTRAALRRFKLKRHTHPNGTKLTVTHTKSVTVTDGVNTVTITYTLTMSVVIP